MTKPCSCGYPGCPELGPQHLHSWDPLAEPVDDCGICGLPLDEPPGRLVGTPRRYGPIQKPVRLGTTYAHPECAG